MSRSFEMKSSVITTLVAAPLLSLSSMAFAAEPPSAKPVLSAEPILSAEPVLLSAVEMDRVTAAGSKPGTSVGERDAGNQFALFGFKPGVGVGGITRFGGKGGLSGDV
jgi:hypothetical protein